MSGESVWRRCGFPPFHLMLFVLLPCRELTKYDGITVNEKIMCSEQIQTKI